MHIAGLFKTVEIRSFRHLEAGLTMIQQMEFKMNYKTLMWTDAIQPLDHLRDIIYDAVLNKVLTQSSELSAFKAHYETLDYLTWTECNKQCVSFN